VTGPDVVDRPAPASVLPPDVCSRTPNGSLPMRARSLLLLVVMLALLGAGCAGSPPESSREVPADAGPVADDPTVAVLGRSFAPETLVVEEGTTVTWVWEDTSAHDVVGDGFDSGIQSTGTFTFTFGASGTYPYVCTLHPGMDGTVIVVP
jgi:plastocyanin